MEWATATAARLSPRRARRRWNCEPKYDWVRLVAQAASTSAGLSQFWPRRVLPLRRLLALMLLPGHRQAHEARWWALGKALTSGPISARITSAVQRLMPGMASKRWIRSSYGAVYSAIRSLIAARCVLR